MVGFSRVSRVRVSMVRVRIRVSVRIRVRFSFNLNRKTLGGELLPERPRTVTNTNDKCVNSQTKPENFQKTL